MKKNDQPNPFACHARWPSSAGDMMSTPDGMNETGCMFLGEHRVPRCTTRSAAKKAFQGGRPHRDSDASELSGNDEAQRGCRNRGLGRPDVWGREDGMGWDGMGGETEGGGEGGEEARRWTTDTPSRSAPQ